MTLEVVGKYFAVRKANPKDDKPEAASPQPSPAEIDESAPAVERKWPGSIIVRAKAAILKNAALQKALSTHIGK
ncbi:MAG: hypothetical protein DHS20C10_09890 [marine bacterium B5-7]|nr:MAG: hypothetical protein DHS20C10_09890 [marine bacterium B5-7]